MHPLETISHIATGIMGVKTGQELLAGATTSPSRFGPFVVRTPHAGRGTGMSGVPGDSVRTQIDGVGVFSSASGTKVALGDPNELSQLTWIDAKVDANGNLVPVDPNYNLTVSRKLIGPPGFGSYE